MAGRILYEPVLVSRVGDSVFVEVHPDAYALASDPLATVLERASAEGYVDMVNIPLLRGVIQKRDGIARDVTR